MKLKLYAVLTLVIMALLVVSSGCAPTCPAIGDEAPDFTLQNTDGESVSLSDFKGNKVIVNLWHINCVPCVSEMPHFQSIHEEWSDRGLKVLTINVNDRAEKAKEFASENKFTFTVLIDSKKQIFQLYCLRQATPITLFIDEEGILKYKKLGAFSGEEEIENILNSLSEIGN